MSFIQFIQSRIHRGSMEPVSLHRANTLVRKLDTGLRLELCAPKRSPHSLSTSLPYSAPRDARLEVRSVTLSEASAFVNCYHRHHASPVGHLYSLGSFVNGVLVGVAIIGRPVARLLDDGITVEVTRLASAGIRNVSSKLLGAARKEAAKRQYARVVTYTLPSEGGASLRAAGYIDDGAAGGGTWSRESRARTDRHPTDRKTRWVSAC